MEDVEHRIAAIQNDHTHGAMFLAIEAARSLAAAAVAFGSADDWAQRVRSVARRLAAAKPAMAAVGNATAALLARLLELGPEAGRTQAPLLAERLIRELEDAAKQAATVATTLLPSGATVLTCSYSSAVLRTLRYAYASGKQVRALVLASGSGTESHGLRLAWELDSAGVRAVVVADEALPEAIARAQAALIGADAVTPRCVINGTPSLLLARAAQNRIPLYVVCETVKFVREVPETPGYDQVPLSLVQSIATEAGLVQPADVPARVEELTLWRGQEEMTPWQSS